MNFNKNIYLFIISITSLYFDASYQTTSIFSMHESIQTTKQDILHEYSLAHRRIDSCGQPTSQTLNE
jgi:hypothetical protein